MCTVLLPPRINPTAVNKYININNLALDGFVSVTPRSLYSSGKRTPTTQVWRLGGLQSWSGRFEEGKNLLFLRGNETRIFGLPSSGVMTISLLKSWKQEYKCQGTRFYILAHSFIQWVNIKVQAVKWYVFISNESSWETVQMTNCDIVKGNEKVSVHLTYVL